MSDLGDFYRDWDKLKKVRKQSRMREAQNLLQLLTKHNEFHYSTTLQGKRLNYWPTTSLWRWKDKNFWGNPDDLVNFLKRRGWK